jgi:hypothetical protein
MKADHFGFGSKNLKIALCQAYCNTYLFFCKTQGVKYLTLFNRKAR